VLVELVVLLVLFVVLVVFVVVFVVLVLDLVVLVLLLLVVDVLLVLVLEEEKKSLNFVVSVPSYFVSFVSVKIIQFTSSKSFIISYGELSVFQSLYNHNLAIL
jgi:hypothetical protein